MENNNIISLFKKHPNAIAKIKGSSNYPNLRALAKFFQFKEGVIVLLYASGLPTKDDMCKKPIFAVHIHNGTTCSGNETDPFADAMKHYNPNDCPHPYHAGDLPPVFGANGYAFSMFFTDRLSVNEVIGKTIIIHSNPDDFKTQPSGDSGEKIACGIIMGK